MFQNLKAHINRENLNKVKSKNRYLQEEVENQDVKSKAIHKEDPSDDQFDDYDFEERQINFEKNIKEDEPFDNQFQIKRDREFLTPQCKTKKLERQLELAYERTKLIEETKNKEIQYLSQNYERQILALTTEISTQKIKIKKIEKDDALIASLRKQNKMLLELRQADQRLIESQLQDINKLKRQKELLSQKLLSIQSEKQQNQIQTYINISQYHKIQQKVIFLQRQYAADQQRKKMLEKSVQKLRFEIVDLKKNMDGLQRTIIQQKQNLTDSFEKTISKIQQQNKELKTKNQYLQESIMQHLTQTSEYLYRNQPRNTSSEMQNRASIRNTTQRNTTTINLHEESPIKSDRQSNRRQINYSTITFQDPQKQNSTKFICESCKNNETKSKKLREKLSQANNKIIELLKWKCQQNTINRYRF